MKILFITLLLLNSIICLAAFPPTTSKISGDASNITTFNYQFPNFTGTHTGITVSLGVNGIAGGGTGQTTANAALNALLPTQSGHSGEALFTNGTDTAWQAASGSGTVTNISSGDSSIDITNPTTTPDIRVHWPMIAGAAGTAGSPAITWGGSGIYQSSYGLLNFSTSGIERFRLENNGDVIVAPGGSGTLTVNGNITATGTISASNLPPTGSADTLAQFNGAGVLASSPWSIDSIGNLTNISNISGTLSDFWNWRTQTNMTSTVTGVTRAAWWSLQGSTSVNANVVGLAMDIGVPSSSDIQLLSMNSSSDASIAGNGYGLNIGMDSPTTGGLTPINIGTTNTVGGNYNGIFINNGAIVTGDSSMYSGSNYGNTTGTVRLIDLQNSGTIGADFRGALFNNSGTVAGFGLGVFAGTSAAITKGWDSFSTNISANVGDGTGVNLNAVNFTTSSGITVNGGLSGLAMANQADVTGGTFVINYSNSGTHNGITGINVNNTGTTATNSNVVGGNITQNATGYSFSGWDASCSANQTESAVGFSYTQSANARTATGININMAGSITDDARGLGINVTGLSTTSGRFSSIESAGGTLSINSSYDIRSSAFVDIGNYVAVTATAPSNITGTDSFIQMVQSNLVADHSIAMGPLGIGTVMLGLVSQATVGSSETVDKLIATMVGTSIPSGSGGNITDYVTLELLGLPSFGGTVTVPTVTMLQDSQAVGQALCDSASTSCFGVRVRDGRAQNTFAGGVTLSTSGSQPTCDVGHRGLMWNIEGGTGVADVLQVCQKDASDTYVWVNH